MNAGKLSSLALWATAGLMLLASWPRYVAAQAENNPLSLLRLLGVNPQGGRRGPGTQETPAPVPPAGARSGGARSGGARGPGPAIAPQSGVAWWTNPAIVMRLGLTETQVNEIAAAAERFRQPLAQQQADLQREEATLNRMLNTDPVEPAATVSLQIDRVVQLRGEVERTNARMTLAIRQLLTSAQWAQLQAENLQSAAENLQSAAPVAGQRGGRRGGPAPTTPIPPQP